jgi:hypothetical protein
MTAHPQPERSAAQSIDPVVVVAGYRRPTSLGRLLSSLRRAHLPPAGRVLISLEGDATDEVRRVADHFAATSPVPTTVVEHDRHLGLRDHLLWCGDRAVENGAAIVLEDDLVVDPWFHAVARQACQAYAHDARVAGVALYAPEYNEFAQRPFEPMANGHSTYLMQLPCSWGQCWTAAQWQAFRAWLDTRLGARSEMRRESNAATLPPGLPPAIAAWSSASWKKHFAAFMIETGRWFVYPYTSTTTNVCPPHSTNLPEGSRLYQTRLPSPHRRCPQLDPCPGPSTLDPRRQSVSYDAFMEPSGSFVSEALGLPADEVVTDLYGQRPMELRRSARWVVVPGDHPRAQRQFARDFRPHEMNLAAAVLEPTLERDAPSDVPLPPEHEVHARLRWQIGWSLVASHELAVPEWDATATGPTLDEIEYHAGLPLAAGAPLRDFLRLVAARALQRLRERLREWLPSGKPIGPRRS